MESREKIDQDRFLAMMMSYTKIQPYRAPDFSLREVAWYYYQEFKYHSLEMLQKALDTHIRKHDHFPSIRELNASLSGKIDDDIQAKVTAMNIIGAISKFGYCNWNEAKIYLGDLGVKVVDRFGGWNQVCEMLTMDNVTYLQNLLKESTKSYLQSGVYEYDQRQLPSGSKAAGIIKELAESMNVKGKDYNTLRPKLISCEITCEAKKAIEEIPW